MQIKKWCVQILNRNKSRSFRPFPSNRSKGRTVVRQRNSTQSYVDLDYTFLKRNLRKWSGEAARQPRGTLHRGLTTQGGIYAGDYHLFLFLPSPKFGFSSLEAGKCPSCNREACLGDSIGGRVLGLRAGHTPVICLLDGLIVTPCGLVVHWKPFHRICWQGLEGCNID